MSRYSLRCAAVIWKGLSGECEGSDLDARVPGFTDGFRRAGEGPAFEGFVADRMTELKGHEELVYDELPRAILCLMDQNR